ncbi:MAG: hypothetical protein ACYDC6_04675 [Acidobacteriaceae bacterium]
MFTSMVRKTLVVASLFVVLPAHGQAPAPSPTIQQIMPRVQSNLAALKASLPDIFCTEKVDSRRLHGGKLKSASDETDVTSTFSIQRAKSSTNTKSMSFTEDRKILTVNGKPFDKKKAALPFSFVGGFINGLIGTFDVAADACNSYTHAGEQVLNDASTLLIEIKPKDVHDQPGSNCSGNWRGRDTSSTIRVWVDAQSMQVVRYEWRATNLRFTWHGMPIPSMFIPKHNIIAQTTDYSKVDLGGKSFWLPSTVKSTIEFPGKPLGFLYAAQYGDYHRYGTTAKLGAATIATHAQ